jgi:hypothetical protein
VLVDRGGETEWCAAPGRTPAAIVHRFDDAAAFVLRMHGSGRARAVARAASMIP